MIEIIDKSKCCGCRACAQICPKNCITFEADNEGFSYPSVQSNKCIDCGLCERVCPEIHIERKRKPISVIAAVNKSEEVRNESSSGGMFTLIADSIIKQHGVVFGACFDSEWNVIHSFAETRDGIKKFQKSKYVQSDIKETFREVKTFLSDGRKVLFTGTPCQISALKHFLRKDYDNLLTMDFVCHGVPSPMVWRDYLEEIKCLRNIKEDCDIKKTSIKAISFRDKCTGWEKFSLSIDFNSPLVDCDYGSNTVKVHERLDKNQYMRTFLDNVDLRLSCYSCPFKCGRSGSDITIADFWGVELFHPRFSDNKGTSLVMSYTTKGKSIIDTLDLEHERSKLKYAIRCNSAIVEPHRMHPNRTKFFKFYHVQNSKIQWMKECEKLSTKDRIFMGMLHYYDRILSKIRFIL